MCLSCYPKNSSCFLWYGMVISSKYIVLCVCIKIPYGWDDHPYHPYGKLQGFPTVQIWGLEMKRLALPRVLGSMLVVLTCGKKNAALRGGVCPKNMVAMSGKEVQPLASRNNDLRISRWDQVSYADRFETLNPRHFAQVSPIRQAAVALLPCLRCPDGSGMQRASFMVDQKNRIKI